ncbi:MAG: LptF/LptG family permease [Planctomycetes bacterium]|nr:LptF/LptG family permease [Planctomycetota bacterium]
MIKRLDRYVLRNFLRHWIIVAIAFLSMFSVLDLVGEVDEISDATERFGFVGTEVALYYLYNLPYILLQFAPYITLLAALATVLSMRRQLEWTPMLVAGRSTMRAFLPMFVAALSIGFLMLVIRETAFPKIQTSRAQLQSKIFDQKPWQPQEIWLRGPVDQRMFMRKFTLPQSGFEVTRPIAKGMELFTLGPNGEDLYYKADRAAWDGEKWLLTRGRLIIADDRAAEKTVDVIQEVGLDPAAVERAWRGQNAPLELTLADARELLKRDPGHRQAATLIWSMLLSPFAHLILLLLGLPYVLSFERRTSMEGVAMGLLFCAMYFVLDFLFQDFGHRGHLSPWMANWAPILLFGGFSLRAQERFAT